MSIQCQLRSFWWFLEGRVGGMGRPGFNQCHWFELPFEEGAPPELAGQTAPADRTPGRFVALPRQLWSQGRYVLRTIPRCSRRASALFA